MEGEVKWIIPQNSDFHLNVESTFALLCFVDWFYNPQLETALFTETEENIMLLVQLFT